MLNNTTQNEINRYLTLNRIAESYGTVIFGGSEAKEIPLCELKQAFELNSFLYNRSFSNLSVKDATQLYDKCIAKLKPETIFLHIGEADLEFFSEHPTNFGQTYRELIEEIKSSNPKCNIVIVSLKNPNENATITELNKHLKYIAESERYEYCDISTKRVWNPRETKDIISFVYSTGFVRPLKAKKPVYDLVKILFCYEPTCLVK